MGAIAERPKPGATVGETFSCLIGTYVQSHAVSIVLINFKFSPHDDKIWNSLGYSIVENITTIMDFFTIVVAVVALSR